MNKKRNPRAGHVMNNRNVGSLQYMQDLNTYNDYYGPSLTYLREHPDEINLNKPAKRSIFDDYDNAPTLDENKTWYQRGAEYVSNQVGKVGNDLLNAGRLWTSRFVDNLIDKDLYKIDETSQELEDLNRIKEYKQLQQDLLQKQELFNNYVRGFQNIDDAQLNPVVKRMWDEITQLKDKIGQYDDYFMGEGRSHTVIAQQMFDKDKMDLADIAFVNSRYITKDAELPRLEFPFRGNLLNTAIGGVADLAKKSVMATLDAAGGVLDSAITSGALLISNITGNGDSVNGYKTGEVIKKLDPNNAGDRYLLDKLYKGYGNNFENINDDRINQWIDYNNRKLNELSVELYNDLKFAKDGKLFGIDIYDPEDIPQLFLDEQEKFGESFTNYLNPYKALLYTFPETASTVSLFKYLAEAVGLNGFLHFLSRKAPVWAIGGKTMAARGMGNILKSDFSRSLMETAAVGSGVAAARASRRDETGLESISALGARVSNIIQENGGDVDKIVDSTKRYANKIGIDTDGWELDKLIKFALAYNINTGDQVFDLAKSDARKGINKLINANNALAVVDYLQALPFMEYSGSVMKKWASDAIGSNVGKYGAYYAAQNAVQNSKPVMQAVSDATIGKVANKFIRDGKVGKGLFIKHTGDYVLNKIPLIAGESFSEGLEEINQELLLSKFQRGLYDSYNKEKNMLDIHEVFDNVNLSFEGLAAYAGITPWDPELSVEDIRRAFHIGAAASAMFAGALRASSNVLPGDSDNMRNFLSQLKNDRQITNIVANYYNQVQDLKHLELFFDAFTKAGVNRERLLKALLDIRNAVDEQNTLVRKDFVDSDIQLMNAAWSLFNNERLNEALGANDVEKYSDTHKLIIVDGASAIVENWKNQEKIQEGDLKIQNIQRNHIDIVSEILSESTPEERLSLIKELNPELYNMVSSLKEDYQLYKQNRDRSNLGKFAAFSRRFDSVAKFAQHEGVRDYITQNGLHLWTTTEQNDEEYDPLLEEAKNIFIDEKLRKKALRHAFQYENRQKYSQLLLDQNEFFRNKYIRQYARDQVVNEYDLNNKLREIYNDKNKRQKAINAAFDTFDNGTYSMNDYVIERIHLLHNHLKLQRLIYARLVAADKARRNAEIRKLTGLDTYTGLDGIVKALDEEIAYYKKIENRQLNSRNTPEDLKLTWADLFRNKNYKFDDQQEYDLEFSTLALNRAINGPLRVLAAAYLMGYSNPQQLSDAIFGEDTESNVLNDIVEEYNKLVAEDKLDVDLDTEVLSLSKVEARRHDKELLSKKAAWRIIKKRLDENLQRRKIANRIYEEEGPITPAITELEQNLPQQQEEEKEGDVELVNQTAGGIQEAPLSDAERRLNQKYNHEKGKQKTIQEKIEERRKRRQNAVVEDVLEEPEEDVPEIDGGDEEVVDGAVQDLEEGEAEKPSRKDAVVEDGLEIQDEEVVDLTEEEQQDESNQDDLEEEGSEPADEEELPSEESQQSSLDEEFDINEGEVDDSEFLELGADEEDDIRDAEKAAEELEELANTEATVLENGWVMIEDYSGLEYNEEGFLTYDGEILPAEQQLVVVDDLILQGLSDSIGFSQDELPDGTDRSGEDERTSATNDKLTNLISLTFFYQPEPKIDEATGQDQLPKLTVDGKEVKLDKPLASGRQLSKKLSQPGWLRGTKKYFIVTQSLQGLKVARDKDARDAMTVAMVIEDETNSYVTFLRPLGLTESDTGNETVTVDSETARRSWLLSRHVDWRKVIKALNDTSYSYADGKVYKDNKPLSSSQKVLLYLNAVFNASMERAKQGYFATYGTYDGFEHWFKNDPVRENFVDEESWQKAVAERKRLRKLYRDRARQGFAHPGKTLLTEEQVDAEINSLRRFRNKIIDAYLTKQEGKGGKIVYKFPSAIKKSVTPVSVVLSNGKINSQKDKFKNPIYRTISKPDSTIDEIQQLIESGDIMLGYGLGMFANPLDRFAIRGLLDSQATVLFNGRGLSGKIYLMVKGPAEGLQRIPIMLAEERFDTQVRNEGGKLRTVYLNNPNNLVLCLKKNPTTGQFENVNTYGYLPSAAEIIFYMLINQLDVGLDAERHLEMVEFFIHSGEKTLLKNQPKSGSDPFNVLGRKQLAFHTVDDVQVLTIGMPDENGKYVARDYTVEEMMMQTEDGENLRKQIIGAIATLMHWNTDIAHMNSSINVYGTSNSSIAQLFRWAIYNFAKDYSDNEQFLDQRVQIFGCPQLSFRMGDFFTRDGDEVKPKQDVSVLAWMIKEGKIKTDTGEQEFTAPFVFANGVQVDGGMLEEQQDALADAAGELPQSPTINVTTPKRKPKKLKEKKLAETQTFNLSSPDVYQEMVSDWREGLEERRKREGWYVAQTEEEREKVRESINQTKDAKDNGGINDRIMIRSPKEKVPSKDALDLLKKILKDFLTNYNKSFPDKAVNLEDIAINELTEDLIKSQWALKKGYIILDLYKNGKAKVQVRRDSDFSNWRNPVTGVFSKTIGGSGTLEFDKARKWLSTTLGIDEDNIVLTSAIMRSATNEDVFGLTNVVMDRIAGEVTGYMKFSEYADAGIEYHEAWHYVNLLMHDKVTRARIYESYINTHKALKRPGVKIKDVEEAMADDFKVYMEGFVDSSISGKVRRLFRNILDFLIASRRKSEYRIVYKAIANGEYSAAKLDRESVIEFLNRYKSGVAFVSHSVPGLSRKELEKMTNVRSYQDIFDGTNAVINRVFSVLDLTSPKKMQAVANSGFGKILLIVDDMIGEQSDENKIAKLQDIRANERFLRKALIDAFMELGIVAKVRKATDVLKVLRTEVNEDALKKEDDPDNTWDKFTLSSQRKENASLSTKMFLRLIPIYTKQYLDDGSVQYDLDRDDYGTVRMYDSDQAWRKILDTLWMCDSYSELDENGRYSPTSIMGIVESHKNVDPFFYSLYEKLRDLDLSGEFGDIQLKSQILSTVNSSKAQIQLITIQNPIESKTAIGDEILFTEDEQVTFDDNGAVADKRREWILRNDSLISVARNLPRTWSKNLASNGLLGFNGTTGQSVVDRKFVAKIEKDLDNIQKIITKYTSVKKKGFVPKSESQLLSVLDELKPKIIDFYNELGIESDMPSLNVYIAMMSGIDGELTVQQQIDTLQKIFNSSAVGSISYVVDGLSQNVGGSEVTPVGSKYERAIDEAFSEYSADSHIGILAIAWSAVHPSSQEFSVKDANGNRLYPINLNSYISDGVRAMNDRRSGYIRKRQRSSYCKHSVIAEAAKQVKASDPGSKIKLNTFVGIRDANNAVGADYFGITAAEDYIAKLCMTEDDLIIFPTMADKKTWNSLSSKNIKLTHDTMIISPLNRDINKYIYQEYELIKPYVKENYTSKYAWLLEARKWYRSLDQNDETRKNIIKNASFDLGSKRAASVGFDLDVDNGIVSARFSDVTLQRFAGYFLDELNSLIDYYNKDAISRAVNDKNSRVENYHGKVKDGRMDFSGNGGKFRYLYDIPFPGMKYNLNHTLQGLFELQKKIESGKAVDRNRPEGDIAPYIGTKVLGDNRNLDGFELIREYLLDLKKTYFNRGLAKQELLNAINRKLVDQTEQELFRISRPGSPLQLVEYNKRLGVYVPKGIPEQLLNRYTKILQEANYGSFGKAYDSEDLLHHALFSLIGSHVVNTATSIIETEKIFTGDPSFYKKKAAVGKQKITIDRTFSDGEFAREEVEVENLDDVFSDKIKRLGGTLSPGQELRLDFNDDELSFDPTLRCSKYTNLNIEDIKIPSLFLDEIEDQFKRQLVVDRIRSHDKSPKGFNSFFTELQNQRKETNKRLKEEGKRVKPDITFENAIDRIYSDKKVFERMWSYLTDLEKDEILNMLLQQMAPYKNITVADALVFIRPDLYRKIRIALGQWSIEPDETGYSDEEAYNILEGITVGEDGTRVKNPNPNDEWSKDPALYEKVRRLLLFPLKMSYFQNDEELITDKISINRPIYNKMAIFPLFAFLRSTSVGKALYDRMNEAGNELDMISFKSAVKVGAVLKGPSVTGSSSVETAMSKLNDDLSKRSNVHLDYSTGETIVSNDKNSIPVVILDLKNLRMLLNTLAHEAELRAIGTQMFKIAFSNIIDDAVYGTKKSGRKVRRGDAIKRDIISCINALTRMGIDDLKERFYRDGKLDDAAVQLFVESIVKNNGLGSSAEEIIANGGVAAGVISRTVFENSTSAVVNSDVIDINTKGGTAIQQSVFGFVGYGNDNIGTLNYNSGRELKWSAKEGSMQVMLSMNFFRSVIPDYKNKTPELRREWLIQHNIIGDNAKPFGVGYRIPTQGMSSMFAFQVADVLPELVGDLIIVPREFTALTGSDFDVDKLFLATMSYKDGVLETLSDSAFGNRGRSFEEALDIAEDRQLAYGIETDEIDVSKWLQDAEDITKEDIRGAITNRLLLDYIDIISDRRNYADARGSIDVITNMLHDQLLDPVLKAKRSEYIVGMSELLPSFQAMRKMEFGVGKSGIGPFALNITNLALTLYTHLTMDFGNIGEEYGFGDLDKIYGRDGLRISSWLSAMVNAHVDVAKDPYVFDLNVNQLTYNHANLLIRAGMGISTFTFLAQPSLKDYANTLNNSGGLYGDNLEGDTPMSEVNRSRKNLIYKRKLNYYRKYLTKLLKNYEDAITDGNLVKAKKAIEYYEYLTSTPKLRREAGYTSENKPQRPVDRSQMFSEIEGKRAILNYKTGEDVNADNVNDVINSLIFLLAALESFKEIDAFAQLLSQLVQCSQIDTKKFGNTIHDQINFANKYDNFRLNSSLFTINDESFLESLTPADENKGLTKQEISKAALHQYFNLLYLNLKFRAATRYTREILSRQLFSATGAYESLFKNILGIINGFDERFEMDGTRRVGYKEVYNKKSIDSFADGVDNMMRFNSFMALGPSIYKNAAIKHGDTRMIDFTMGGDIQAVVNKFMELTMGSKELKSIFVRLGKFINQIKKNPYSEKADGLVDGEGNIVNDLLLYLNPQTPNGKYTIGRMLLKNSQTENKSSEERRLISAFGQLLEHSDEEVRLLARDIAFYAYFSAYDLNSANSFFHLVPSEYRAQYDIALKNSLNALSSNKPQVRARAIRNVGGMRYFTDPTSNQLDNTDDAEMLAAANMIDVLSRNYWFDDNIVPVHYTTTQPTENKFQSSINEVEEFTGPLIYDAVSGRMFPTYIASTRVRNNSIYIKVRKGSGTFLYKRVGAVSRKYVDKSGNEKYAAPYYIYIAIPKAGLHSQGINLFEFYADYNTPSIFEENKLEKDYAEDLVRLDIEDIIKEDDGGYYQLEVVWDNETVPQMYTSSNTQTYIELPSMEPDKRRINGITVYNKKDPEKVGLKNADVIIDIVNNKTTGDVNRPNIKEDYKDKVVELALDGDISDTVKAIQKIKDKDVKIHITTPIYDGQFDVTDEEVEEYIKEELNKYSSLVGNVQDLDTLLKTKEDALRSNKWTKRNVGLNKLNNLLHNLTLLLVLSGVTITRYSSAARDGNTQLSIGIAYVKSVDGVYLDSDKNTVFVDKEFSSKKKKFRGFLFNIDYNSSRLQSDNSEETANVSIPEQELETSTSKVELVVAKNTVSKFAKAAAEMPDESEEDENIPILEEAAQQEEDKENSNNQKCGAGGSARSRFAAAADMLIIDE